MKDNKPELKIEEFTKLCYLFNYIKDVNGVAFPPSKTDLVNQWRLVAEENKEMIEALDMNNLTEVLDATVDILVTTLGLLQQLESIQGIDVNKALIDTANNNLSKFIKADGKDADLALKISKDSIKMYDDLGKTGVQRYLSQDQQYIVLLNKDNKVMKPSGFVPNNLEYCLSDQAYTYWNNC